MKQYNIKQKELSIEFWVVTALIVMGFIFSIIEQVLIPINSSLVQSINANGVLQYSFSLFGERFIPILFSHLVVYICYLLLNFHVGPELDKQDRPAKNVLPVYLLIFACIAVGIINIYWAQLLAIKILFILLSGERRDRANKLFRETGYLLSSWIMIICASFFLNVHTGIKFYLLMVVPTLMLFYLYAMYNLIPSVFDRKWKFSAYFFRMLALGILSSGLLALIVGISKPSTNFYGSNIINSTFSTLSIKQMLTGGDEELYTVVVGVGNFFSLMLLVLPFTWQTYKRRNQQKEEQIISLKTELGKSDANLNFLKSQINPHFLFNALNTLYGTALQENAERTGEGIQKLGDMMRFMLQENIEDKILLSRDVDYLNNYIALQKLRTSVSSQIHIETQIEEHNGMLQITPMLLIPFVENAFKHGISLNNPSHIKITLQIDQNTLYFDVHNSIHIKSDNDPEKLQSGIGLQNVQQRLSLLYPDQHELIIRQNAKEFFIHLTLQLTEKD